MTSALESSLSGRRARKKADTRRRIRQAALELAQQYGVEHVTVERISEAADVSTRTFFNYFACKQDALVADPRRLAEEFRRTIAAQPADDRPLTVLRHILATSDVLREASPHRAESKARYRLVRENPSLLPRHLHQLSTIDDAIEEGMRQRLGADADDVRPELLAAFGVSVLRVAIHRWARGSNDDWAHIVDSAFAVLDRGFN